MIGETKIHGKRLLGLTSLVFSLLTARPTAMKIVVRRDPSHDPNALLFHLTTNENGTEKKFDGSFELRDAAGNITHVVEFHEGSAQSYQTLVADNPNTLADEQMVIVAPKFTIKADGKVAEFASRESRHVPGK